VTVLETDCVTMGNLFGRKKESRVTEQDKAILVSSCRDKFVS